MRSMLPRKVASVFVRTPLMRRSFFGGWAVTGFFKCEPAAGSIVHDMF
jgi:hypothetical protein